MRKKSTSLSHLDEQGQVHMVDVGGKAVTERHAVATGQVRMQAATLMAISDDSVSKGDVLATARIAGIQAAKHCSTLIPLCHPLMLTAVTLTIAANPALPGVELTATCRVSGKTGVEMEALTAVSVAALTVYDMCKAIDRSMVVTNIQLEQKAGGASGDWRRE